MNRLIRRWMVCALVGGLGYSADGQHVPKVPDVDVSTPSGVLDLKVDDVCATDFSNVRMFVANANLTANLKNGKYKRQSGSNYESVRLNNVFCFKQEGGGRRALVITNWMHCRDDRCTSVGVAQVFELRGNQPLIAQQFVFGTHADGTGVTFDEKSLTLKITGRSDDGSPTCCAKNFDVVTYQWQGAEFKQASYERVPAPKSRILVQLEYDKIDLPSTSHSTCLVVFRDGRFQMGQLLVFPASGTPRFLEDSLPVESINALNAILEVQELKDLGNVRTPSVAVRQGEMLNANIYREQTKQSILFEAVQSPAGPAPKLFPASLGPLLQWIQETSKAINQRTLSPLENVKSLGGCWPDKP